MIFTNGMVVDPDGQVRLYYGAADETTCLLNTSVDELLDTTA